MAQTRSTAEEQLLLIGRFGDRRVALPGSAVERILPMAALTLLPGLPFGVVGVLDLRGAVLPVVDARPNLGLNTPQFHPSQRLVVMSADTRYLLWMDAVDRTVSIASDRLIPVESSTAAQLSPHILQLEGEVIAVLSPKALDPGPILQQNAGVGG